MQWYVCLEEQHPELVCALDALKLLVEVVPTLTLSALPILLFKCRRVRYCYEEFYIKKII